MKIKSSLPREDAATKKYTTTRVTCCYNLFAEEKVNKHTINKIVKEN